jgi:beta-phosphoglucomutase-like phosphatase (HAD superfamily)
VTEPGWPVLVLDRLEAGVFDTDGVLTDTAGVHAAAWKRLFDGYLQWRAARLGEPFRPVEEADYLRGVDGRPRYDGVAGFLASRGITLPWGDPADPPDRETVCGLGNAKDGFFLAHLRAHGARPLPTSVAFVRQLRERGLWTAVVSASRNMVAVLDSAGLGGPFDMRSTGARPTAWGWPASPTRRCSWRRPGGLGGTGAGRGGRGRPGRGGGGPPRPLRVVVGVDRGGQAAALAERGAGLVVADLGELILEGTVAGRGGR